MEKLAFIFPGQGSQYVGMCKDFYEDSSEVRQIFDIADRAGRVCLEDICFEENDLLGQTEYTQIAMLTCELAILSQVEKAGYKAGMCAGLSLGEYAALKACRALDYEELFTLIRKRGIYMQNAYPVGGAMTAVLGLDEKEVEQCCDQISGQVSVANYNCPGQIVITGKDTAVKAAAEACMEKGAKKCIPLRVSGPFHSELLKDAADRLTEDLKEIKFDKPLIPYICNCEAREVTDENEIAGLLGRQLTASVRWQQSMEYMLSKGIHTFIEMGPGRTLAGFARRIDPEAKVISIQSLKDLECLKEELPL